MRGNFGLRTLRKSKLMHSEEDDVANGDEEERFETGVRRSALDFVQHDKNADKMLDYDEYCALVREREEARGGHTDEELRLRFDDLDDGKTGRVSLHSYIRASLREALSRSATRVIDLFRLWDEDGSGTIERKEFRRAIRALGFDFFANNAEIDLVFDDFDIDGSGELEYKELNTMLRQGQSVRLDDELLNGAAGAIVTESKNVHRLRKQRSRAVRSVLPSTVILHADGSRSVIEQLRDIVKDNWIRVIDLFRSWDEDGDGLIDRGEFRKAIAALGFEASREHIDAVFAPFDIDGSGKIEYSELRALLHRTDPTLDASFRPGAAGEIELSARRKRTGPSAPVSKTTPTRARSSFSKEPSPPIHSPPIHSPPRKQQPSPPRVASLSKQPSPPIHSPPIHSPPRDASLSKQPSPPRLPAILPAIPTGGAFGYGERMVTEREMRMRRSKLTVALPSTAHTTPRRSAVAQPTPNGAKLQRWPIGDAVGDPIGNPNWDGDNDDGEGCDEPERDEDLAVETAEGARESLALTLRSKLDGVLVGGGDGGEQLHRDLRGRMATNPPSASLAAAHMTVAATSSSPGQSPGGVLDVALKPRYLLSEHGRQRVAAATAIQALVRGRFARTSGRTCAREWLFGQSFRRVVCLEPNAVSSVSAAITVHETGARGGEGGGPTYGATSHLGGASEASTGLEATLKATSRDHEATCTVHVRRHERLELVGASGHGRLLLDAHDMHGRCVVAQSCVYDSSLQSIRGWGQQPQPGEPRVVATARGRARGGGPSALMALPAPNPLPALCCLPGEFVYSFRIEAAVAAPTARPIEAAASAATAAPALHLSLVHPSGSSESARAAAAVLTKAEGTISTPQSHLARLELRFRLECRFTEVELLREPSHEVSSQNSSVVTKLLREPSQLDRPSDSHSGGPLRAGGRVQGAQQTCSSDQQPQRHGDHRLTSMAQATPSPSIPARTLLPAGPTADPRRVERRALFSVSTEAIEAARLQARLQEHQHIVARAHAADVEHACAHHGARAHAADVEHAYAHHGARAHAADVEARQGRAEGPRGSGWSSGSGWPSGSEGPRGSGGPSGHAHLIALDGIATPYYQRSSASHTSTSLASAPPPFQWPGSFPYGSDPAHAYYYGLLPPPWQDARKDAYGVQHLRHDDR